MADRDRTIMSVADDLRRVIHVAHEYSKRAERVTGVTGPQLWALKVLGSSPPMRVSDLARRMYLHPSTVVGILDRLESRGLVSRTRSREDRREVSVGLTGKGRKTAAKTPEAAQMLLLMGLESLSRRDLKIVSDGLRMLVGLLGAQTLPPKLLFSSEVNRPSGRETATPAKPPGRAASSRASVPTIRTGGRSSRRKASRTARP